MKQTKKRIGSLLLAMCMLITMLPAAAYAAEGESDNTINQIMKTYVMSTTTTKAAISAGVQKGALFEGVQSGDNMFGNAVYKLTTEYIGEGKYTATVANLPAGVSVKGGVVTIDDKGTGTLELTGNTDTKAGTTELALTVKGVSLPESGVTSNTFDLTVIDREFTELNMEFFIKPFEANMPNSIIALLYNKTGAHAAHKKIEDLSDEIKDASDAFTVEEDKFKNYFNEDNGDFLKQYLEGRDKLIADINILLEEYKAASDELADAAKPFFKDEAWEYAQLSFEIGLLVQRMQIGVDIGKITDDIKEIEKRLVPEQMNIIIKHFGENEVNNMEKIVEDAISEGKWGTLVKFYTDNYNLLYDVLEEYGIVGGNTKEYYGLTVCGVIVTSENSGNITGKGITGSGTVSYNPDNKTLTLNNAEIAVETKADTAIKVTADSINELTIKLIGENQLGKEPSEQRSDDYTVSDGITAIGKKITVTGEGNLTIYDRFQGITAKDITIDTTGTITILENGGGEACCLKAEGGTLEIKSGTLNLSSAASNSLYGNEIIISGGTITAESLVLGNEKHYAFNNAPDFASGYRYKVFAGESRSSAAEISEPAGTTFTKGKYVKILPDNSGSGNHDGDDDKDNGGGKGKDKDGSSSPAAPAVPVKPAVPAEGAEKPVEDILTDVGTHWALNSIQAVYKRGIMTGTSANEFSPDAQMSRGMLITALGRLAGINALDFTSRSFGDVDMASYYGPYAEWSLKNNIVKGTGAGNFSPENSVTREELAVILLNFARAMEYELPSGEGAQAFEDDSSISPWAREAVEIMRNANIMQGDPSNSFNPKAPATRAEIAAVLQRFIDYMKL